MRSRAEALSAVRDRLDRTAADQDPRWVLGELALADAGELAAACEVGGDLGAAYLLGMFYWFRFEASEEQAGHDDVAVAALFLTAFTSDPGRVPEPLRRLYQQPGCPDAGAAARRARTRFAAYQGSGQRSLLWEAVVLFRAAVTATPAGHPDLAGYLSGLGSAVLKLAERTRDTGLLVQAVLVHRAAVGAAPPGHPDRAAVLANLGATLQKLGEQTGDTATLQEAVHTCQQAADAATLSDCVHPLSLSNLGNALLTLAEYTGDIATLDQAVKTHRAAVAGTPSGDPDLAGRLANLGTALEAWYERTGNAGALREAAQSIRGAIAAVPAGRPAQADYLSNLGATLQRLFERTMETAALTEAVSAHQAAVAATPGDHADRARRLSNLGTALRALADRTADTGLLQEAVDAQLDAVTAAPAGDPGRAGYLSNLSNALLALAERTEDAQTLQDGIDMSRMAADAAPAGHPEHAANLSKLNGALLVQARRTHDDSAQTSLLDQAVQAGQDAVAATPVGHPDRAMYLDNLGAALQALVDRTGQTALLDQAGRCFAQAATDTGAPAAVRISGYQSMARLPSPPGVSPRQALETLETAAALLPRAVPRTLTRADRQYSLGRLASIAPLVAAAAVAAGQPGRGVELLEQTRGILAADTLDARDSDLARLRTQAPGLAEAFEDLRARIDTLASPAPALTQQPAGRGPDPAQARRDAAAAWDDLLARIRTVGGLKGFLRTPDLSHLAAQARYGPIIFPYATPSRCDALILTGEPGAPVRVEPLPGLTENDATSQANRLLRARRIALGEDTGLRARRDAHNEILDILAWMWDVIAGPILTSLGYTETPAAGQSWPRVWWCPVGILGYLPLHASGHHDDTPAHPQPRAVLDRVISSYTTTVRGLSYARSRHPDPAADSALIIAVTDAAGTGTLEGAAAEADNLARLIPRSQILPDPTRQTVLDSLPAHPLVHFACHGYANWTDPGASMLILPGDQAAPLPWPTSAPSTSPGAWPICPLATPPSPARISPTKPSTSPAPSISPGTLTSSVPCGPSTTPPPATSPATSTASSPARAARHPTSATPRTPCTTPLADSATSTQTSPPSGQRTPTPDHEMAAANASRRSVRDCLSSGHAPACR